MTTKSTKTKAAATPFDRVKDSAERAAASPCLAATGPKRDPRPCKGVGVVDRETVAGKQIKVCAAHVLATDVSTVAERIKANAAKTPKTKALPKTKEEFTGAVGDILAGGSR